MWDYLSALFDTSGFPPRWHCGTWTPFHGWLHILSDLSIWMAYFTIPCILAYFGLRRRDLPYRGLFYLFGVFIFACGTTHLMEVIIFWQPHYRLAGIIKLVTAVASWGTVLALVPIVPQALALRGPLELEKEINERKLVDAQLQESEAKFRGLLESAPDGLVIIDDRGRIELVNAQIEAMFGYRREELLGQNVETLLPARFRQWYAEQRKDYFANPNSSAAGSSLELYALRKNGRDFPIDISLSPLITDNGLLATAAVRDASDRKRAEQRILQSERLAGIGQTVAGLAHEGRNALQQIQGCVELLRLKLPEQAPTLDLVASIEKAQDRLHRLFEEVRGYAAPLNLQPNICNLAVAWREAWEELSVARKGRDVTLREEAGHADLGCICDMYQLQQVFRNIFDNSLAACPDPVVIDIQATAVTLDRRPALQVSIRDNGPGFQTAQKEKIFDAFFTTKTRGTGLGLAIAKRILEAHSGRIDAGTAPQGGAEITITLLREPN